MHHAAGTAGVDLTAGPIVHARFELAVHEAGLRRGARWLAAGIGFQAGPGDLVDLRGANGSGKTTLLRAIAGLCPLAEGKFECKDSTGRAVAEPHTLMHFLGHADGVKRVQSSQGQLHFWARFWGVPRDRADEALESVGLAGLGELPGRSLSAGQRKRLALARLLVAPRPIWLLDEPTSALDIEGRALLGRMIAAQCASGGIVIAASHEPLPVGATRVIRFVTETDPAGAAA